ncbi:MAG TPA: hypothetical protein VK447_11465 [Myxococcaceae bacterium]|nr:hypothetical protein [Myxococcaceae bacterium]
MASGNAVGMRAPIGRAAREERCEPGEADAFDREAHRGPVLLDRRVRVHAFFPRPAVAVETVRPVAVGPVLAAPALAQTLYWGMPRGLRGHVHSGQLFAEANLQAAAGPARGDRRAFPLSLEVKGSARRAYSLAFKLAEHEVVVNVPRGATAEDTARCVADAINRESDAIAASSLSAGARRFGGSELFCAGVLARADGGTVRIRPHVDA